MARDCRRIEISDSNPSESRQYGCRFCDRTLARFPLVVYFTETLVESCLQLRVAIRRVLGLVLLVVVSDYTAAV